MQVLWLIRLHLARHTQLSFAALKSAALPVQMRCVQPWRAMTRRGNGLRSRAIYLLFLRAAQDLSYQHQFLHVIYPFTRLSSTNAGSLRSMLWIVPFVHHSSNFWLPCDMRISSGRPLQARRGGPRATRPECRVSRAFFAMPCVHRLTSTVIHTCLECCSG